MKTRFILSLALFLLGIIPAAFSQSAAPVAATTYVKPGCGSKCSWSNCTITAVYAVPPGGACACGCYGGLAMCKCEENETRLTTNSQVYEINVDGLAGYKKFIDATGNPVYHRLSSLLATATKREMKSDEYLKFYNTYKEIIQALPAAEQKAVLDYSERH